MAFGCYLLAFISVAVARRRTTPALAGAGAGGGTISFAAEAGGTGLGTYGTLFTYLALTFRMQKNVLDLVYFVEASSGLDVWDQQGTQVGPAIDNGDGTESITIRDSVPINSTARRFVRLRVLHTP